VEVQILMSLVHLGYYGYWSFVAILQVLQPLRQLHNIEWSLESEADLILLFRDTIVPTKTMSDLKHIEILYGNAGVPLYVMPQSAA